MHFPKCFIQCFYPTFHLFAFGTDCIASLLMWCYVMLCECVTSHSDLACGCFFQSNSFICSNDNVQISSDVFLISTESLAESVGSKHEICANTTSLIDINKCSLYRLVCHRNFGDHSQYLHKVYLIDYSVLSSAVYPNERGTKKTINNIDECSWSA